MPGQGQSNRRLPVKVTPNAGKNEITGLREGVLLIKIGAAPDKGKANKELTDFLSSQLGVKKSAVLIVAGQSSRNKVIEVEGLDAESILKRLKV